MQFQWSDIFYMQTDVFRGGCSMTKGFPNERQLSFQVFLTQRVHLRQVYSFLEHLHLDPTF